MNFIDLEREFGWVQYAGQMDKDVTYLLVLNKPVARLRGESDILYIGKTEQAIAKRFKQETNINNSPRNTQQTNIRLTHVLGEIGQNNYTCYFVRKLVAHLSEDQAKSFLEKVRTWDKKFSLSIEQTRDGSISVPIEKYLLVRYASEHLEVPPLNNRM